MGSVGQAIGFQGIQGCGSLTVALQVRLWLVAEDMAHADLTLRGLVFVGVGLLMLAMNAFYTRFHDRFR